MLPCRKELCGFGITTLNEGFKPITQLTALVAVASGALLIALLLTVMSIVLQRQTLNEIDYTDNVNFSLANQTLADDTRKQIEDADRPIRTLTWVGLALWIATGLLYSNWLLLLHRNTATFGYRRWAWRHKTLVDEYIPLQVVFSFFPRISLEIWNGSERDTTKMIQPDDGWADQTFLLNSVWSLALAGLVFFSAFAAQHHAKTVSVRQKLDAVNVLLLSVAFQLIVAVILVVTLFLLHRRQING